MTHLMLLSDTAYTSGEVLPALDLLNHRVTILPLSTDSSVLNRDAGVVILIDARDALVLARNTAQLLKSSGLTAPLLMVLTEGGMAAVSSQWLVDDIILDTAGPAELEARLRLASAHSLPE